MRAAIAHLLPQPLERSFYVWIASVLFIVVCALWRPVPGVAWRVDEPFVWVLRAVQAAGVWLTLRSAVALDIRDLAGLRAAAGGAIEFKTSGPYGWVRHPIYTGWFLMVFAASPMTMTRLVFAVVSCAYLIIAIPFEERSMPAARGVRALHEAGPVAPGTSDLLTGGLKASGYHRYSGTYTIRVSVPPR